MSNTIQSKPKQKTPASSYVQLPPARNTLSINKMPPSHISNGNASLSKVNKNSFSKVEIGQGVFGKTVGNGGGVGSRGGGKEGEAREKIDKVSYGGWMRGGAEDRRKIAWGKGNKPSK